MHRRSSASGIVRAKRRRLVPAARSGSARGSLLVAGDRRRCHRRRPGQAHVQQQPMKMAAAEALCADRRPAPFSLLAVGDLDGCEDVLRRSTIPACSRSWPPATSTARSGHQRPAASTSASTAPATTRPIVPVTYWSFRADDRFRSCSAAARPWSLWVTRKGRRPAAAGWSRLAVVLPVAAVPGQLVRLDLHRDGPPALDRLRPAADRPTASRPTRRTRHRRSPRWSASPCCTACSPCSGSA